MEYKPCSVPKLCWDIMTEFMNKFMISPKTSHHLQANALEYITPRETTQQYNDQFNNLRKSTINTTNLTNVNSPSSHLTQTLNTAK